MATELEVKRGNFCWFPLLSSFEATCRWDSLLKEVTRRSTIKNTRHHNHHLQFTALSLSGDSQLSTKDSTETFRDRQLLPNQQCQSNRYYNKKTKDYIKSKKFSNQPRTCKLSARKLNVVSRCCFSLPGVQITMFVRLILSRSSFKNCNKKWSTEANRS